MAPRVPPDKVRLAYHAQFLDAYGTQPGWHEPVEAASTANGTLATAFESGDSLDGITLRPGYRILLKDQSTGSANGIYIVQDSGAPVRASDMPTDYDALGAMVLVTGGTLNGGVSYRCDGLVPQAVGTAALTWIAVVPKYSSTGLGCKVTRSTTQAITTATMTKVLWNANVYLTLASMHSTSSNTERIVVPVSGLWLLEVAIVWAVQAAGTLRYVEFYKNNSNQMEQQTGPLSATTEISLTHSAVVQLLATDYVEVRVYQDSGSSVNLQSYSGVAPFFSATLLGV